MGKFEQVLVLEVECAKDKSKDTPGGKYRRDTPWLMDAFRKKGLESWVLFITKADTAEKLAHKYPNAAFLGRVNPMDYPGVITLDEYINILDGLTKKGLLLGPVLEHMNRLDPKMILYELKDYTMGSQDVLLHSFKDIQENNGEIDKIIPKCSSPRVLKIMRGSTGLGVWKLAHNDDNTIIMTDAYNQITSELPRKQVLQEYCKIFREDAISMPFFPMIKDGEYRFVMSKDKILDIVHKQPVDDKAFTATLRSGAVYKTLKLEEHNTVIKNIEAWAQNIKRILNLNDLPYWWSVDCIEDETRGSDGDIPSPNNGRRLILSEINCSCLGLVVDTSPEAKVKGMRFATIIADTCLDSNYHVL